MRHFLVTSLLLLTASAFTFGQGVVTAPDEMPQRGISPNGFYTFDKFETIDQSSGNLMYHIPLTSMPMGRGGMTFPFVLTYNSLKYDFDYTYGLQGEPNSNEKDLTYKEVDFSPWGGWQMSIGYGINQETHDPNSTDSNCNVAEKNAVSYRYSLMMPDGAHHTLYLENYSWGTTLNGYYPLDYFGQSASTCTGIHATPTAPLPQTWITNDGSYIRIVVTAPGAWTATFPDGTTVTNASTTQTLQDRNGNKITIASSTPSGTTVTDDLGRQVTFTPKPYNGFTLTQTGVGGGTPPLTWSFTRTVTGTPFSFYYDCGGEAAVSLGVPTYSANLYCQYTDTTDMGGYTYQLQAPGTNADGSSTQLTYTFQHAANSGLLSQVQLPSGATTSYTFQCMDFTSSCFDPEFEAPNTIKSKTVTWNDVNGQQHTEPYQYQFAGGTTVDNIYGRWRYQVTAPDNGVTAVTHYGTSGPVLRTVKPSGDSEDLVYQCIAPTTITVPGGGCPNQYVAEQLTSKLSTISSVSLFHVDLNGNQISQTVSDWIPYASAGTRDATSTDFNYQMLTAPLSAAPSPMLKNISLTYSVVTPDAASGSDSQNAYWHSAAPNLLHLLASKQTSGQGGNAAFTQYMYDDNTHGNPQYQYSWDSTKAAALPQVLSAGNSAVTSWTWDSYGNLLTTTDPRSIQTTFGYDSQSYCLNSKTISSLRHFTYVCEPYFGLRTKTIDVDNQITTNYGYDALGRPTSTMQSGGGLSRNTALAYDDVGRVITTTTDQTASTKLVSKSYYDELNRVALTQQQEPRNGGTDWITVQTLYGFVFRGNDSYVMTSNPYLASTAGSSSVSIADSTAGWTVKSYDQDGRETYTTSYTGSGVPTSGSTSTGTVTTVYGTGSTTNTSGTMYQETETVSDQLGNTRVLSKDGLGRLTGVREDPSSLNYLTYYSYDSLDNLALAQQSSLSRSFSYSSLGRLLTATNPESGSISYSYDADGNILTKTDPLRTTCWGIWSSGSCNTSSAYDQLNEPLSKSYSDGTTPPVSYQYANGRLTQVSNSVSTTSLTYDGLGRIQTSQQQTLNNLYGFTYGYNLTDALTSETYPSGRQVTTNYDGANRVYSVTGSFNGSTPTYANNLQYSPHGAATQVAYGNGLWRTNTYNSRLQLGSFVDDLNQGGSAASQYNNVTYGWGTTANNGNLQSAMWNYGGAGAASFTNFSQTFTYDNVNRLKTATDSGWSRNYFYDGYGNMAESGSGVPFDMNAPVTATQSAAGLYNANNQLIVSGMVYDAAGNLSQLAGYSNLSYDGENRLTSAGRTGGVSTTYQYDGEGRRVVKTGGGNQIIYVYDAAGRMAAEYSAAADSPNCVTCYLSPDHLGTPRLTTDQNGYLVSRHDYLPFGEEITTGQAGRNGPQWDAADLINQKFTGKERDSESGLDYFGARYYGSALGRFTSPDWSEKPQAIPYADISDPQTLNLYAYVRNRPLSSADIDGHCTSDGQQKGFWWCLFHDSDQDAEDARKALAQMHGFNINGQSPADFAKNATNQQAIQGRRQADMWLTDRGLAICGEGVSCGVILPPIGAEFGAIEESEIATAERSGTALTKADAAHRSTSFVIDDLVKDGQKFWITGNDGKRRLLIQLGNQDLNGNAGRYEIIYDPETKTITHQRFVEGGTVNGQPNKP